MFATLFFGVLDIHSGAITYINGGHEPPVLVGPAGVKLLLQPTGPVVGIMPDVDFTYGQARIMPGDALLACTDSVTEAYNRDRELFSQERLLTLLAELATSISALIERVETSVRAHIADGTILDDIRLYWK